MPTNRASNWRPCRAPGPAQPRSPSSASAGRKLRIDHSTPFTLVGNLIEEKITALFDGEDSNIAYEVVINGQPVIADEAYRERPLAEAQSSAQSLSGAGMWILAILLIAGGRLRGMGESHPAPH